MSRKTAAFALIISLICRTAAGEAKKDNILSGGRTITLRTRDSVLIVGSFFLPPQRSAGQAFRVPPEKMLFETGVYLGQHKDMLGRGDYPKVYRVYRIPISEGRFSYTDKNQYVSGAEIEAQRKEMQSRLEKEAAKAVKKSPASFCPLIPFREMQSADPLDSVLSPYGSVKTNFHLSLQRSGNVGSEAPCSPRAKEESAKKESRRRQEAIKRYLESLENRSSCSQDERFRFDIKPSRRLLSSCFTPLACRASTCYPGVLLLHMWKRDRAEWNGLVPRLLEEGFAVLAIDMRGHGESVYKNGRKIDVKNFVTENYRGMVDDAFAGYEFLIGQDMVDSRRISLVGASLGTVISVRLCEKVNALKPLSPIRAVALMSPSRNFFAVRADDAIRSCTASPFLFVMDKKDPTPEKNDIFVSGFSLYESFPGRKESLVLNGVGHGTAMLQDPGVTGSLVKFLVEHSR